MELKKYKLGEILDVIRGASLSGEFYATEGEYIRLTCGNFDIEDFSKLILANPKHLRRLSILIQAALRKMLFLALLL